MFYTHSLFLEVLFVIIYLIFLFYSDSSMSVNLCYKTCNNFMQESTFAIKASSYQPESLSAVSLTQTVLLSIP